MEYAEKFCGVVDMARTPADSRDTGAARRTLEAPAARTPPSLAAAGLDTREAKRIARAAIAIFGSNL
jgi:hypothetical protein